MEYTALLILFMFVIPALRRWGMNNLRTLWQVRLLYYASLVALLGGMTNIFVSFINLGMPVKGLTAPHGIWKPMTDATVLGILGDIIPTPIGMASIGDILLVVAGLMLLVCCPSMVIERFHLRRIKAGVYRVRF